MFLIGRSACNNISMLQTFGYYHPEIQPWQGFMAGCIVCHGEHSEHDAGSPAGPAWMKGGAGTERQPRFVYL